MIIVQALHGITTARRCPFWETVRRWGQLAHS
jgi:hypothetical protein